MADDGRPTPENPLLKFLDPSFKIDSIAGLIEFTAVALKAILAGDLQPSASQGISSMVRTMKELILSGKAQETDTAMLNRMTDEEIIKKVLDQVPIDELELARRRRKRNAKRAKGAA